MESIEKTVVYTQAIHMSDAVHQLYCIPQAVFVTFVITSHPVTSECYALVNDVGGKADNLRSVAELDKMIAHSLRDIPDDDSDDLSDTEDPDLLVATLYSV